jgi:hypothetical protein
MKISEIKKSLKERFEIKDLDRLKYFLGIEIAHSIKDLFIFQRKYTLDLLKETGKLGSKPATTPIDSNCKLNIEEDEPLKDVTQYQRLVGKLIYLTITRSDISFVVNQVSKFIQAPRKPHLDAIDRILRYLKGHPKRVYG